MLDLHVDVPISGTFGPNGRDHHRVTNFSELDDAENDGWSYYIRPGEIMRFPRFEELEVEWVSIKKGSKKGYHIVKCQSEYNGKKKVTWFALPQLRKVDVNGIPVNPTWFALGSDLARLKKLCELGEIRGLEQIEIQVVEYDSEGNKIRIPEFDEEGYPKIKAGFEVWHYKTRAQHPVVISPC